MREGSAPKIDVNLVQGQPLALVNGQRPGEPQGELLERARDRLDDLVFRLIERVAPAFPRGRLDLVLAAADLATVPLTLFMALSVINLFTFGLMFSNFTALAMEPQGHIAGTASSLFGSMTTLIGIVVGSVIGQFYNETVLPLATGAFLSAAIALVVVMVIEKGRLFVPRNKPV